MLPSAWAVRSDRSTACRFDLSDRNVAFRCASRLAHRADSPRNRRVFALRVVCVCICLHVVVTNKLAGVDMTIASVVGGHVCSDRGHFGLKDHPEF